MNKQPPDITSLTLYLLGQLPEEEQVRVEDRAFSDPDYLSALEDVEADLIDSYVRGQLPAANRLAFERRFFTSRRRVDKVEFARALSTLVAEVRPLSAPVTAWWSGFFSKWSLGPRLAAGLATVTLVAGTGWLAFENAGMRTRIAALETRGLELQTRSETAEQALNAELGRRRSEGGTMAPAIATLTLLPGLTRAETNRILLAVPPAAQLARIEIQLEARDDYARFHAELRTADGQEVLTRANLPRRRTPAGASVSFDVPASALTNGDYELELKGISGNQAAQPIGYYYFRVAKP